MKKYGLLSLIFFIALMPGCGTTKIPHTAMPAIFDKEGHRGCRGLMPENTIAAMLKAIDLGVTTLEMDISFTKDKVAILSHEPFFNHDITTLPDGKYFPQQEEKKYNIYQMSFAESQQYDVGLKAHPRYPNRPSIKATKPSFTSMVDSVESYLAQHQLPKVDFNIETKTNPLTDNIFHPAPEEFVERLMELIKSKGIESRVIIQSFDFRTLQIIHQKYPGIRTAMLIEGFDKRPLEAQLSNLGFTPTIYSPEYSLVNKSVISACHDKQMKIIPWTVNDKNKIKELKEAGVDGIISDFPNLFNE